MNDPRVPQRAARVRRESPASRRTTRILTAGWVVVAALTALSTGCGGASTRAQPSAPPAVITAHEARQVLNNYITTLNQANKSRDSSLLATVETGSTFPIDSEGYSWTKVTDPGNQKEAPVAVANATFSIPSRTIGAPWWAARIRWGQQVGGAAEAFFVFTKVGGKWLAARSPGLLPGASMSAPAPGRQGYASELTTGQAASLAVRPSDIGSLVATYLNQDTTSLCPRPGLCAHPPSPKVDIAEASKLADMQDMNFWRGQAGGMLIVGDQHTATTDPVYALRTAGQGALVWCDVSAQLTVDAPGGSDLRINIPSYYTNSQPVTHASVPYLDQFLVYDPPQGQGNARVVADMNGPVPKG